MVLNGIGKRAESLNRIKRKQDIPLRAQCTDRLDVDAIATDVVRAPPTPPDGSAWFIMRSQTISGVIFARVGQF